MKVLVIKISSLGDIIHTLPALSDAARQFPNIQFDWLVEAPFQEIPKLHPYVNKVIVIQLRQWRKAWWKKIFSKHFYQEMYQVFKSLRETQYDFVIDAQGLLKSAVIAMVCQKNRMGYSWKSIREPFASLFYQHKAVIPWQQHAIKRVRALFALSLGYPVPETVPSYGLEKNVLQNSKTSDEITTEPYYVFLHGTTWDNKHWPENYWVELGQKILQQDSRAQIKLLWGNEVEQKRALRLTEQLVNAIVLPKMNLTQIAHLLKNAKAVITVDTGLGHFAAALGVTTLSLYGPTDPEQCGIMGVNQRSLSVQYPCAPCRKRVCQFQTESTAIDPPCYKTLSPNLVWEALQQLIKGMNH